MLFPTLDSLSVVGEAYAVDLSAPLPGSTLTRTEAKDELVLYLTSPFPDLRSLSIMVPTPHLPASLTHRMLTGAGSCSG